MKAGNLAIFASGSGSNALKIIESLDGDKYWKVSLVLTNNPQAGVIDHAKKYAIPFVVVERKRFAERPEEVVDMLHNQGVTFIALAGFLLKIPPVIVDSFPGKMINIHPSLLPEFGGKGMYGDHVHRAVIAAGRQKSGITIHLVNGQYDEGPALFQAKVSIDDGETPESLRKKIQGLEHRWFPEVLMALLRGEKIPLQHED